MQTPLKRYPLRKSQLSRICRYQAQLEDIVSLSELLAGQAPSVEQALATGAVLVGGDLEKPETTRWLPVEKRQKAALEAKAHQKRLALEKAYRAKGLKQKGNGWRYEEKVAVGPLKVTVRTHLHRDEVYPSGTSMRKVLAKAKRQVKTRASELKPIVDNVCAGVHRLEERYPGHVKRNRVLNVLQCAIPNLKTADIEKTATHCLLQMARDAREHAILNHPDKAEIHVGRTTGDQGTEIVSFALVIPGQKPRITFQSTKRPVDQTVAGYLRGQKPVLKERRVVVYVHKSHHLAIAAQEDFDRATMLLKGPVNKLPRLAAAAYRDYWVEALPASLRQELNSKKSEPLTALKAQVFTDASKHPSGNGIASVLYLPETAQPLAFERQTREASTHVLEARAVMLGFETLDSLCPAKPAKILTDNLHIISAFDTMRDTGVMPPLLRQAGGEARREWLLEMTERYTVDWVPVDRPDRPRAPVGLGLS